MSDIWLSRFVACTGCTYFSESTKTCDYLLMTERRRPCPPGIDCTVKRTPEVKRISKRGKLDRNATLRQLYKEGLNDREISKKLGYSVDAIFQWRVRHGYAANYKGGRPSKSKRD